MATRPLPDNFDVFHWVFVMDQQKVAHSDEEEQKTI